MTDSTRINELQDKMLQAMSIVNGKLLDTISYDTTITATISDNTNKADGKYILTDGSKTFTAYSTVTNYSNNTIVYVTIPNGNWENQKMIIGKKTSDAETPFVFTTPFDTIFDMTGNVVTNTRNLSILANGEQSKIEIFTATGSQEEPVISSDFTRLGLSADFCTWLKDAVSGTYGIRIDIEYKDNDIVGNDSKTIEAHWIFDNNSMYGDTYNFESYYNQQIVFDISDYGAITKITLSLVQLNDFYRIVNEKEKKYPSVDEESGIALFDNIFVKDVYLCAGHDIGVFQNDYVEIYTEDKKTYDKVDFGTDENKRNIKLRWVHVEDGEPKKIEKLDTTRDEIRWYRYHIGQPSADAYCGVYWEYLTDKDVFSIVFTPDTEWQQEKIKAIVFRDNVPYRSNELIFENEETVPSYATIKYQNALQINPLDGSQGNYMVYRQDNDLKDEVDSKEVRSLELLFDTDLDDIAESTVVQDNKVTWTIPIKNSMLQFTGYSNNDLYKDQAIVSVTGPCPTYTIRSYYSPNYNNNTIACSYILNGRTYTTEREFTFGYSGTMGTDQTIVIDFAGDTKCVTKGESTATFVVRLYDSANKEISIPEDTDIKWFWKQTGDNSDGTIIVAEKTSIYTNESVNSWSQDDLKILGVSVGDLTTYFPVPIRSSVDYAYISGATQVIYQTNGEPSYCTDEYKLYKHSKNTVKEVSGITWGIIGGDEYKAAIKNNKLSPIGIYLEGCAIYGVVAKQGNTILWTQPILVMQNRWSSNVLNKWSGKEISIDNENGTIVAPAIAAGKKESEDNSFSGVMLGSWGNTDTNKKIAGKTGIYGFNHGKMAYAFQDDGTAFIGKSGYGRINFNGNYSTLYSSGYEIGSTGMKIDLNAPSIDMRKSDSSYIKMDFNSNNYPRLRVQSGSNSYFLLDSKSSSSTIYLKNSTREYIRITSDEDLNPLQIGSNFYVDWDGKLNAKGGFFKGTLNADTGYLDDLTVQGDLAIAKGGSLTTVASTYDTDGPIYIKYNSSNMGSFGIVIGKDGDSNTATYNIGILSNKVEVGSYYPSIILDSQRNVRLSAKEQIFLNASQLSCNVPAAQQKGIYARFA